MNKKLVLLSLTVTLAALMMGQAMATPVQIGEDTWVDGPICPPSDTPLSMVPGELVAISEPEKVWVTDDSFRIKGLELAFGYTMFDDADHVLPGVAYLTVDAYMNVTKGVGRMIIHIILDNDYGWWEGDMLVRAVWNADDTWGAVAGSMILYGHGALDCWTWDVKFGLSPTDVSMSGHIWNPLIREWNPIVMANPEMSV